QTIFHSSSVVEQFANEHAKLRGVTLTRRANKLQAVKKASATLQTTFHTSSVVEQSAVNRSGAGSNPACGAIRRAVRDGRRSTIGNHVGPSGSQGFKSLALRQYTWPVGQVVKTSPFHGGITGSNPVRVTILFHYKIC